MVRRSLRLQESGYYREDGSPNISYKETLYKVFRQRKYRRRDLFMNSRTQQNKTGFSKLITTFLMLLLLTFGIVSYAIFTKSKQEVTSLRQQMTKVDPLEDTLPNLSSESQRAMILSDVSSWTYFPRENSAKFWLCRFVHWMDPSRAKRRVIQEYFSVPPCYCWPLAGQGKVLTVSLSQPASITAVTLGHLKKHQLPDGTNKSAPRVFSAYGMLTRGVEGTLLGTFLYDSQGEEFQTFNLPNPNNSIFRYVKFRIESNSGDQDFTWLYNFRVHGKTFT